MTLDNSLPFSGLSFFLQLTYLSSQKSHLGKRLAALADLMVGGPRARAQQPRCACLRQREEVQRFLPQWDVRREWRALPSVSQS